jgi:MarR family transcriptional regulator, organic hydroperoxide resistance regulator
MVHARETCRSLSGKVGAERRRTAPTEGIDAERGRLDPGTVSIGSGCGQAQARSYSCGVTRRLASSDNGGLVRAERDIRARIGDRPLDFRSMAAISNIYRAATTVRNHMEQTVLAAHDLSWAAFTVLWVLWIWGEQETRHLADEAGVTKGTLTGVVNTLERRGLAIRSRHPDDGRLVLVRLSPRGLAVIEELFPLFNEQEGFASSALTLREKDQLAQLLRKVTRTVADGG